MADLSRSTRLILLAGALVAASVFVRTLLLADPETGLMPGQLDLKPLVLSRDHVGAPAAPLDALWLRGDYASALELAERWADASPRSLDAPYWAALSAIALDDAQRAQNLFRALKRRAKKDMDRAPGRGLRWLRLAWAEQGLGNPEAAIEALAFAEHAADVRVAARSDPLILDLGVLAATLSQRAAIDPEAPPGLVDRALDALQSAVRAEVISADWARIDPALRPLRTRAPSAFEACLDPMPFNPRSLPLLGSSGEPAVWRELPLPVGLPPE
ncbi:MAG: hypothetical protein AAGG07_08135 [Planctomycetota bacterium]